MDFTYSFSAIKGIQANKEYYIAMVPLKYISRILPEPTEYVPPEYRAQRRLNESRIPEMKNYIIDNRDTYIFSSLTASIDGKFKFKEIAEKTDIGMLHISMDAKILVNDGQHRRAAIVKALFEDSSLENETISIVFFEDKGLENSQQMFSDLNMNAQKSSNSINTCYETRNKLAVTTKKIVAGIPFLSKYTNMENDTLGKNSSKLFTLNKIYRVNELIFGKEQMNDDKSKFLYEFWNAIVENIPEWSELERKEITKRELREEYITTLGVTLLAFSRLGIYFKEKELNYMIEYMAKLKDVNWSRSNPIWKNRMIGENGKIINNREAIILTGNAIKNLIGIPLSQEENNKEKLVKNNE